MATSAITKNAERSDHKFEKQRWKQKAKISRQNGCRAYRDVDHARDQIGPFLEQVYNRQRLHSALDYLTPAE
jgi:putative transposase